MNNLSKTNNNKLKQQLEEGIKSNVNDKSLVSLIEV